ncbi:MAG: hypothetical protein U0V72_00705 [Cytophagales bacterium]
MTTKTINSNGYDANKIVDYVLTKTEWDAVTAYPCLAGSRITVVDNSTSPVTVTEYTKQSDSLHTKDQFVDKSATTLASAKSYTANKGTCEFPRVNYMLWNCVTPTAANQAIANTSFYAYSIPTVDAYIKIFTLYCQTVNNATNIKLALYSIDMNTMSATFEQNLGTYAITSVGYKVLTFTPIKLDVSKNYIIVMKGDISGGVSWLRHQGNNTQFNSRFWTFTNNGLIIGSGGALGAVYDDAFPASLTITSVVNQSFYGITYNSTNA